MEKTGASKFYARDISEPVQRAKSGLCLKRGDLSDQHQHAFIKQQRHRDSAAAHCDFGRHGPGGRPQTVYHCGLLWCQRLFCNSDRLSNESAGVWTRRVPLQRLLETGDTAEFAGADDGFAFHSNDMAVLIIKQNFTPDSDFHLNKIL